MDLRMKMFLLAIVVFVFCYCNGFMAPLYQGGTKKETMVTGGGMKNCHICKLAEMRSNASSSNASQGGTGCLPCGSVSGGSIDTFA